MVENTNVQNTGPTYVRKSNKCSRLGLALATGGFAGALLLGGLFGYGNPATAYAQAFSANRASASSVFHVKTATMSSNTATKANDTYWNIAWQAALNAGIDPNLFTRQINQESGFNPNAVSPAGAEGIAQFMPATAAAMGVNPWDPISALYGAARLMAQLNRQFGNYAMALAAYNAGPGAVQYAINHGGSNWYYWLPAETRNYVSVIMGW
jgi:soluble lytic murein transglycosylase-like protein